MKKLFGGILLAVGILIMTGSGLCSLVVIIGMANGGPQMLPLVAVIGGIPFLIGWGLLYSGLRLLKQHRRISNEELDERFR